MKLIVIGLMVVLAGCSSAMKVGNATDPEVCEKHASYSMWKNEAGLELTKNEISKRNIDKTQCLSMANKYIQNNAPTIKLEMCQQLSLYNFKGSFIHYSRILSAIKGAGFYDKECEKMAQLYNVRLRRDRMESDALAKEFEEAPKKSEIIYLTDIDVAL